MVFPLPSPPSSVMKMPVGFLDVLPIGDFHFSRNRGAILCQVAVNSKTGTFLKFLLIEAYNPLKFTIKRLRGLSGTL